MKSFGILKIEKEDERDLKNLIKALSIWQEKSTYLTTREHK